jgi:hypothetical protein
MSLLSAIPIIGKVTDLIDKFVPDKDLAEKLKAEATKDINNSFDKIVAAQSDVLKAEIQGASALQRNWRPILMLTIVAIIANNYIVFPYLSMFTDKAVLLELPDHLYQLMKIGVGGYIVGRSGEKIAGSLADRIK